MTSYCPRTCSRLATAAAFISIGIVQLIAGMILLRSKYVYLLSWPNFWTASSNIAVGALLGISATIWKTTRKKSTKYTARRNVLAALATSAIILNATTTAIMILGEGNTLLSIHLESGGVYSSTTIATEIIAYAYATSVCSPIVCVVIAVAFLTGICYQNKKSKKNSLDLKNILNDDKSRIYSWVYAPKLPKPDPEIMKTALSSSESGLSSSDSGSLSSPGVPIRLQSLASLEELESPVNQIKVSRTSEETFPNSVGNKEIYTGSSNRVKYSRTGRVSFADESSSKITQKQVKEVTRCSEFPKQFIDEIRKDGKVSGLAFCNKIAGSSLPNRKRIRVKPKILFTEYPSGDFLHHSQPKEIHGRNWQSYSNPLQNRSRTLAKMDKHSISQMLNNANSVRKLNTTVTSPYQSSPMYEYALDQSTEIAEEFIAYGHGVLRRTSTTEDSSFQERITSPDHSEIGFETKDDLKVTDNSNTRIKQSKGGCSRFENAAILNRDGINNTLNGVNNSPLAGEVISIPISSDGRAKLSSRLIPVATPIISESLGSSNLPDRIINPSSAKRAKMYSKSHTIRHKTNGFSSFRNEKQDRRKVYIAKNEVDGLFPRKHGSTINKFPMESTTKLPNSEISDTSLPSTSTQTSGYLSAFEESDEDLDADPTYTKRNSIITEHHTLLEGNKPGCTVKKGMEPNILQNLIGQIAKENPHMSAEDILSHLLQMSKV